MVPVLVNISRIQQGRKAIQRGILREVQESVGNRQITGAGAVLTVTETGTAASDNNNDTTDRGSSSNSSNLEGLFKLVRNVNTAVCGLVADSGAFGRAFPKHVNKGTRAFLEISVEPKVIFLIFLMSS